MVCPLPPALFPFICLPASDCSSCPPPPALHVSLHFLSFVSWHRWLCPPRRLLSPFISFHLSPSINCCVFSSCLSLFISFHVSPSIGCCVRLLRPCLLHFICSPASIAVSASSCLPPPALSPFIPFDLSRVAVSASSGLVSRRPFMRLPASVAMSASPGLASLHFLSSVSRHRLPCLPPPALSPFMSFIRLSPGIGCRVCLLRPCLPSFPLVCLPASVPALSPFIFFRLSPSIGCRVCPALSPFIFFRLSPSIGCRVCPALSPFIFFRCLPFSFPFLYLPASIAVSTSSGLVGCFKHRLLCLPPPASSFHSLPFICFPACVLGSWLLGWSLLLPAHV